MYKYFCDSLSVVYHSASSAVGFAVGFVLSEASVVVVLIWFFALNQAGYSRWHTLTGFVQENC